MAATEVTGPEPRPEASSQEVRESQVASLTGMRGFAALMVVLIHTAGRTEYPWLGVHGYGPIALFVLSGFLLYRPFARWILGASERPSLRSFAIRRAARIFPAYWVVLLVWMFVYPKAVPTDGEHWIRTLSLVTSMEFFGLTPGMQQTWSLGTELTWYVALPFLAIFVFAVVRSLPQPLGLRLHVALVLSAFPVSVAWIWYCHSHELVDGSLWLPGFLACFGLGALVGLMMEAERAGITDISRGRRLMSDPYLLPGLAVVFVLIGTSELAGPVLFSRSTLSEDLIRNGASIGLAGSLLVISIFSGPRAPVVRLMGSRFMQATGRWSYGIYLWHLPLIVLLWEDVTFQTGPLGLVQWLVVVTAISYALGAVTYAWVEVPTMAWSRRQSARFNNPRPVRSAARRTTPSHSSAPAPTASSKEEAGA